MSLVRSHSPLRKLIIRILGDVGGPRIDDVDDELNTIFAWAKDAPRCLVRDFPSTPVGNVNAGPDTLHTFTLPSGSLATNGDWLRVRYAGLFAGDNDTKTIVVQFDGQTVSNLAEAQAPVAWTYDIIYGRVSATSVRYSSAISWGRLRFPNAGALTDEGLFTAEQGVITVANLNSNGVILLLQGGDAGSETNDVQYSQAVIELCQQ